MFLLIRKGKTLQIGELEQFLLKKYPARDAESWDRTGLLVGDPTQKVTGVATALDPSVAAVRRAKEAGANVLLTHHPAFLDAPDSFMPAHVGAVQASKPGALVYEAIHAGVALMNFHTALDMNEEGLLALPGALGLSFERTVLPLEGQLQTRRGYGAFCRVPATFAGSSADSSCAVVNPVAGECANASERAGANPSPAFSTQLTVEQLAQHCKEVLGGTPRIWGNVNAVVQTVITAQGSAGSMVPYALEWGVDCLICGELKYHSALAAAQAGLNILELGHDVSERIFAHVLCQAAKEAGAENVVELPAVDNWTCA